MPAHYGYVRGTEGADADQVDVYVGERPDSPNVWVVNQVDADSGKFDEHKAFIGFETDAQVRQDLRCGVRRQAWSPSGASLSSRCRSTSSRAG